MRFSPVLPSSTQTGVLSNLGVAVLGAVTMLKAVSLYRCKPKKCRQECKKYCPVVKVGEFLLPQQCPSCSSAARADTQPTACQASCAWKWFPTPRSHGSQRSSASDAVSA
jgi:hypothetical protein